MLFLDEPTTGLDPQNRANLWDHIRRLRDRGTTVFLTTHYLEEADALCDRLVIMDHGQVVIGGTPRELKQQVAGDSVVLTLREQPAEQVAELAQREPYVRETSVEEGNTLRLYVEDGAGGAAAAAATARRAPASGSPVDEPVGADPRRRLPAPDRTVAARRRRFGGSRAARTPPSADGRH